MDPIFIIGYAVLVTLLLAIAFPRIRQADAADRPRLLLALAAGVVALLVVAVAIFNR
jgi:hypothetical protein